MKTEQKSVPEKLSISEKPQTGSLICYHCGDECVDDSIAIGDKLFCCNGCKSVFLLLSDNEMCNYYAYNEEAGVRPENTEIPERFAYLDEEEVIQKLIEFSDTETQTVTFYIPQMHCSSCIYLLEKLYKLNSGIVSSRVNFLRKEATIRFEFNAISLRGVVELISNIGYEPRISLANMEEKSQYKNRRELYMKIGLAGFVFGNVMLFSFPEYLSMVDAVPEGFAQFFGYLSLALALPTFFYSAQDYFKSAWTGIRQKIINIDVPISLGMFVLFGRSIYEILTQTGTGYLDSLTGLIFFLLVGKLFQQKTYDTLSFERDYKSYFPIAITRISDGVEKIIPLSQLNVGDRMVIRNKEIIPADAILLNGEASIDYSFVTGEATPVKKISGDLIYAGGRQVGSRLELEVVKEVSQGYLTRLWNEDETVKSSKNEISKNIDIVAKYFTYVILSIATLAALYWLQISTAIAVNVFTAVLIVACPCALALSYPFTMGNSMRIMGRKQFFLKNVNVVEQMSNISHVVFDKTGTLTHSAQSELNFSGTMTEGLSRYIVAATANSTHPLSQQIALYLKKSYPDLKQSTPLDFSEIAGRGIMAEFESHVIYLGSREWIRDETKLELPDPRGTTVYCVLDSSYMGHFSIRNTYRTGLSSAIGTLRKSYELSVVSGDNDLEREELQKIFGTNTLLRFQQSPADKVAYVKELQQAGNHVLMVGDGLNDGAALLASETGISVAEDSAQFTPASDGILTGDNMNLLAKFLDFSKASVNIVRLSFVISFLYNIVGLFFAVKGMLSPILAAILMPVSSISVIAFSTLMTFLVARRRGLV